MRGCDLSRVQGSVQRIAAVVVLILASLLLTPTATEAKRKKKPKPPQTLEIFRYDPVGENGGTITLGDVTIAVHSLINEESAYPEIFAFSQGELDRAQGVWKRLSGNPEAVIANAHLHYPADREGRHWVNILGDPAGRFALAAFHVTVTNNTDHILNFSRDAKIYFRDGLHAEPIRPLATYDKMTEWLMGMERDFETAQSKKGGFFKKLIRLDFPVGLAPSLFALRFGDSGDTGFVNKDVLPGFSAHGLLLFPATLGKGVAENETIEVLFFEVPSKTNDAGEIVKRSRASFQFQQRSQPMWYDREIRRWVEGEPPVAGP